MSIDFFKDLKNDLSRHFSLHLLRGYTIFFTVYPHASPRSAPAGSLARPSRTGPSAQLPTLLFAFRRWTRTWQVVSSKRIWMGKVWYSYVARIMYTINNQGIPDLGNQYQILLSSGHHYKVKKTALATSPDPPTNGNSLTQ